MNIHMTYENLEDILYTILVNGKTKCFTQYTSQAFST